MCYNIMAIRLSNRTEHAQAVQKVLTEHGCNIRARLGLHEAGDQCSAEGLMVLQLCGEDGELKELEGALNALESVTAKLIQL